MFGFYRLAAATPRLYLADVKANTREMIRMYKEAADNGAAAVVFPEMSVTGYTIGDLVFQKVMLDAAEAAAQVLVGFFDMLGGDIHRVWV